MQKEIETQSSWAGVQGLSPIMPLLADETVNDILVNGPDEIFIERAGKLEKTTLRFADEAAVLALAHEIAKAVGRQLEETRPLVDARLLDGSRVNIIAPPLAVDGTMISIRKFSRRKLSLDDMSSQGNISSALCEFL